MVLTRSGSMTMITRTWSRPPYQGIRRAEISLGKPLDVIDRALGRDLAHTTAHLDVARWSVRVRDGYGDTRVSRDVPDLHMPLDAIDEHVLAVGVDPGLGHLRRTISHRRGESTGLAAVAARARLR